MVYTDKDKLTIIEIENIEKKIRFDVIATIIMDRPSNMIYCVKDGILNGIISMGDIHRAAIKGDKSVTINTRFTFLVGHEYMRAKKIFLENDKINALPIVDENHALLGDYTRWEDRITKCDIEKLKKYQYAKTYWSEIKKVALVNPSELFEKKKIMLDKWVELFNKIGIKCKKIDKTDIAEAFDKYDAIYFVDEDEYRGLVTLYSDILGSTFVWNKVKTLAAFGAAIEDAIEDGIGDAIGDATVKNISKQGVHVMTIQVNSKNTKYWKNLDADLDKKFSDIGKERYGIFPKELWEEFYDELFNYEYAVKLANIQYEVNNNVNMVKKLKDADTEYYHVIDGERLTVGQPNEYDRSIYFFGPCFIVGWYVDDIHTIESYLQGLINKNGYKVRVVNCGCWSNELELFRRITATDFKTGDIAVIYDKNKSFDGIPNIDLGESLERESIPAKWFINVPQHPNYKVYKLWAETIYNFLKLKFFEKESGESIQKVQIPNDILTHAYITRYFDDESKFHGIVGSIVMNCNPFTRGHRYLIEQAIKRVDQLIIFVVEENKSVFTFKERFEMVREGTKDIEKVYVVPSGSFILSQNTFPEYFVKVVDNETQYNAELDITLFAEEIAPKLNITYRFVGEEKGDSVTNEYNKAMKKILPKYGIQIVEIPRETNDDGTVISATLVRNKLEGSIYGDLLDLIPESTKELLLPIWYS